MSKHEKDLSASQVIRQRLSLLSGYPVTGLTHDVAARLIRSEIFASSDRKERIKKDSLKGRNWLMAAVEPATTISTSYPGITQKHYLYEMKGDDISFICSAEDMGGIRGDYNYTIFHLDILNKKQEERVRFITSNNDTYFIAIFFGDSAYDPIRMSFSGKEYMPHNPEDPGNLYPLTFSSMTDHEADVIQNTLITFQNMIGKIKR